MVYGKFKVLSSINQPLHTHKQSRTAYIESFQCSMTGNECYYPFISIMYPHTRQCWGVYHVL